MEIVNTYVMALPNVRTTRHALIDVLTEDDSGLFAVYRAIIPDHALDEPRESLGYLVAAHGQKLSLSQARGSFPALTEGNYRS